MIYVIDNGETHSDHSIYFVESDLNPRQMERAVELQNTEYFLAFDDYGWKLAMMPSVFAATDPTIRSPRPVTAYRNGLPVQPAPRIAVRRREYRLVFMADVVQWWEGGSEGLLSLGGSQVLGYALKHESTPMLVKYARELSPESHVRRCTALVLQRRGVVLPTPTPCRRCGGELRLIWRRERLCVNCGSVSYAEGGHQ